MDTNLQFKILEKELSPYKALLAKAAETIRDQDVSNYPIFVFHKGELDIGLELVAPSENHIGWLVNASTLEEFVARQIVNGQERIDEFRATYKQHDQHFCLFVLSELGHNFIFLEQ